MARREIYVDDLDGKEHDDIETRHFTVGHQAFTIDLSSENYGKFLADMDKWMSKASPLTKAPAAPRTVTKAGGRSTPAKANAKGYTATEVREWAKAEGIEVNERGRFSKELIEKYEYAKGIDK